MERRGIGLTLAIWSRIARSRCGKVRHLGPDWEGASDG